MVRVWDFVGLLAWFDLGLMTQDMASRPGVLRIGVIWYHRIDDYFSLFRCREEIEMHSRITLTHPDVNYIPLQKERPSLYEFR